MDALNDEWQAFAGQDSRFDALVANTRQLMAAAQADEFLARPMTEAVARTIQGTELLRHSTPQVIDAFFATRVGMHGASWGSHLGTMASGMTAQSASQIVKRANVFA